LTGFTACGASTSSRYGSSSITATPCREHSATSAALRSSGITLPSGFCRFGTTTTARMSGYAVSATSSASIDSPVVGLAGISSARSPRLSSIWIRPKKAGDSIAIVSPGRDRTQREIHRVDTAARRHHVVRRDGHAVRQRASGHRLPEFGRPAHRPRIGQQRRLAPQQPDRERLQRLGRIERRRRGGTTEVQRIGRRIAAIDYARHALVQPRERRRDTQRRRFGFRQRAERRRGAASHE
jgi:hypothetical protein